MLTLIIILEALRTRFFRLVVTIADFIKFVNVFILFFKENTLLYQVYLSIQTKLINFTIADILMNDRLDTESGNGSETSVSRSWG